jgi:hypothetical protein
MTGLMPIQHWILRDFCRLWNRLLVACDDNELVARCVQAQQGMLQRRKLCWLKKWHDAMEKLLPDVDLHACLASGEPIQEDALLSALKLHYLQVLRRMGNPFDVHCEHRKIAFTWHLLSCQYQWLKVPRLVSMPLPPPVRMTWLCMLAGNAHVPARHYTFVRLEPDYSRRVCSKCLGGEVADESHVLLRCHATASARQRYHSKFRWHTSLQSFIHNNRSAWGELPVYVHHALLQYQNSLDVDDMPLQLRRMLLLQRR